CLQNSEALGMTDYNAFKENSESAHQAEKETNLSYYRDGTDGEKRKNSVNEMFSSEKGSEYGMSDEAITTHLCSADTIEPDVDKDSERNREQDEERQPSAENRLYDSLEYDYKQQTEGSVSHNNNESGIIEKEILKSAYEKARDAEKTRHQGTNQWIKRVYINCCLLL
ncbi:hypothetical protein RFI_33717, partial [Reticulomyxa filosa]